METYKITNLVTAESTVVSVVDQEAAVSAAKAWVKGETVRVRVECTDEGTDEPVTEFTANRWR